jgi:hypothetical protein
LIGSLMAERKLDGLYLAQWRTLSYLAES